MAVNPSNFNASILKPGDKVGQFDVLEPISTGGMSVIWKGLDPVLGKEVAIKQIAPEFTDPTKSDSEVERHLARFRKEAALHRKVSNTNKHLVRIIDFIDRNGSMFLVMEYVDGASLDQMLEDDQGPMETRQALGIIAATATGLKAIHQQDVLHRDLKPSNILIPVVGGLKITDFGLATLIGEQDALSLGSARYMAPELFNNEPVDDRADIYSLGLIAYEMLAGRAKFEEAFRLVLRDKRNQALRWMKWHTNLRTQAPPLNELNPAINQNLSDLIARAMEKDTSKRIASAEDIIQAIRRHVSGEGEAQAARAAVKAKAKAAKQAARLAGEETAALPQTSRVPLILTALVILCIVAAAGTWGFIQWQASQKQAEIRQTAISAFGEARADVTENRLHDALRKFQALTENWSNDPELGPALEARILYTEGRIALNEGDFETARNKLIAAEQMNLLDADELRQLIRQAEGKSSFESQLAAIQNDVNKARESRQSKLYDAVTGHLHAAKQKIQNRSGISTPPAQQALIDQLAQEIRQLENTVAVDKVLDEAMRLEANNQRAQAIAAVRTAKEQYQDPRLQAEEDRLTGAMSYQEFLTTAQQAENNSDFNAALLAYQEANKLNPSPELAAKIEGLHGQIAYAAGLRLEEIDRDLSSARVEYVKASKFAGPSQENAQQAIERVDRMMAKMEKEAEGDNAVRNQDWDTAIARYEEAQKLIADVGIAEKLKNARIKKLNGLAIQALREKTPEKVQEARQYLNQSRDIDPSNEAVQRGHELVDRWEQYFKYRGDGMAARSRGEFGTALRNFRSAREIFEEDEIVTLINDTTFEQTIAQTEDYIAKKDWNSANASEKAARNIPYSDAERKQAELTRLRQIIDANLIQ